MQSDFKKLIQRLACIKAIDDLIGKLMVDEDEKNVKGEGGQTLE